jgi:hypothetical protein
MMYRATLPIVVMLSVCSLAGCGVKQPKLNVRFIGARDASDSRLWVISRATAGKQLVFAVFEGGPRVAEGLKSAVTATDNASDDGRTMVTITRPGGATVKLPGGIKLVEIIDGQYKESSERVSLQDFDAFLESRPEAYTIDNLLKFAAIHPGK